MSATGNNDNNKKSKDKVYGPNNKPGAKARPWYAKHADPKRLPHQPVLSGGAPIKGGHWKSYGSGSDTETTSFRWENFLTAAGQKVFNGSSPVDFNYWNQNFQMECQSQGVWDAIAPPDGAIQAMTAAMNGTAGALPAAAIVGALIEDFFTHVKPPDATFTLTRNIMDDRLYHLAEFYNQRLDSRLSSTTSWSLKLIVIGRMNVSRLSLRRQISCISWCLRSPTTTVSRRLTPRLRASV